MNHRYLPIAAFTAVMALAFSLSAGYVAVAQNTTGTPGTDTIAAEPAHPGHIHTGTCDAVGDVVFPLNDATSPAAGTGANATGANETGANESGANETPPTGGNETTGTGANETAGAGGNETPGSNGTGRGAVVAESTTTIEASLEDLQGAEHVINFHESAENIGNYIACGALVDDDDDDDTLDIELEPLNNSGYAGEAIVIDNGDGTLEITVQLWHDDDDDNDVDDDSGSSGNVSGGNSSDSGNGSGGNGGDDSGDGSSGSGGDGDEED